MANDGDALISKRMKWRNLEKHVEIIEHSDLRATRVQSSELEDWLGKRHENDYFKPGNSGNSSIQQANEAGLKAWGHGVVGKNHVFMQAFPRMRIAPLTTSHYHANKTFYAIFIHFQYSRVGL